MVEGLAADEASIAYRGALCARSKATEPHARYIGVRRGELKRAFPTVPRVSQRHGSSPASTTVGRRPLTAWSQSHAAEVRHARRRRVGGSGPPRASARSAATAMALRSRAAPTPLVPRTMTPGAACPRRRPGARGARRRPVGDGRAAVTRRAAMSIFSGPRARTCQRVTVSPLSSFGRSYGAGRASAHGAARRLEGRPPSIRRRARPVRRNPRFQRIRATHRGHVAFDFFWIAARGRTHRVRGECAGANVVHGQQGSVFLPQEA